MSREHAEALIAKLRSRLEARPEILEAYLFGSQARGNSWTGSDLDVAVTIDESAASPSPFGYVAELSADLTTFLGGAAVDIVVLNGAPPLLYHRVLRDGVRLLARNLRDTTAREARALSRYCDFLPQLRRIEALQAARIARGSFGR